MQTICASARVFARAMLLCSVAKIKYGSESFCADFYFNCFCPFGNKNKLFTSLLKLKKKDDE